MTNALKDDKPNISVADADEEITSLDINVAGSKHPIPQETYDGADLWPSCHRPGAYDAFQHPSLNPNGTRRPYRFARLEKTP